MRSAAGGQKLFEEGAEKPWSFQYRNNAHLLDKVSEPGDSFVPEDSNHLLYYDAASLYPSSGNDKIFSNGGPPRSLAASAARAPHAPQRPGVG
jgi:hypothetical protein